jgi:hypothetical protein
MIVPLVGSPGQAPRQGFLLTDKMLALARCQQHRQATGTATHDGRLGTGFSRRGRLEGESDDAKRLAAVGVVLSAVWLVVVVMTALAGAQKAFYGCLFGPVTAAVCEAQKLSAQVKWLFSPWPQSRPYGFSYVVAWVRKRDTNKGASASVGAIYEATFFSPSWPVSMSASSMYPTTTPTALSHVERSVRKREYFRIGR